MTDSVYCSAPWKGLTVREDGTVRTCCAGQTMLGNLNHESIDSIVSGPILLEIRHALQQGHAHDNCGYCQQVELQNKPSSLRSHYQKNYPLTEFNTEIKFLDIRWNNKCNLACQYCNPTFSSVWEDKLHTIAGSARRVYQQELLEWVLSRADQINEIMLVGGEPMLMKQNYELIHRLPPHSVLSIITNLNYELVDLPCWADLLARPRQNTHWNVSVDNTHDQMQYVRNGACWDDFLRNLLLLTKTWPDQVSINCVYSAFNFLEIDKILQFYHAAGVHKVTLQPIIMQREVDIFAMPVAIKEAAIDILERTREWHQSVWGVDAYLYPINGLDQILSQLKIGLVDCPVTLQEFHSKIAWYDSWRTDRFQDLWPNVIDFMHYHLE